MNDLQLFRGMSESSYDKITSEELGDMIRRENDHINRQNWEREERMRDMTDRQLLEAIWRKLHACP